jgi:hypothetical protein
LRAMIELFKERRKRYIHVLQADTSDIMSRAYPICTEVMTVHQHKAETDLYGEFANMLLISELQDHEVRYQLGRFHGRTT